jgi:hypothetical protein
VIILEKIPGALQFIITNIDKEKIIVVLGAELLQ